MASVLGDEDLWCLDDVLGDFQTVSGRTALAQSLLRRWTSDRGSLIDDPDYGTNLSDYINADLTDADLPEIVSSAVAEGRKDERVVDITGVATIEEDGTLKIEFTVTDGEGPFTLTISVNELTVELLTVQEAA